MHSLLRGVTPTARHWYYRPARQTASIMHQANSVSTSAEGPLANAIRTKLTDRLAPTALEVTDDSSRHAGHEAMRTVRAQSDGQQSETHFTVRIVSEAFEGKKQMQRHRLVYSTLQTELDSGLHALVIKAKTPLEAGEIQAAPASGDEGLPAGP